MGYLVAAYLMFWGVTFLYLLSLLRRQRALEERLARMQARLDPAHREGDDGSE